MPLVMVFDTKTQGLPDWKSPSHAPHQPHLVQLAMILADSETRETVKEANLIVKPDGWQIPAEVEAIHGISTARALAEGIGEQLVVDQFLAWSKDAEGLIAYGIDFDMRILRIAMCRWHGDPLLATEELLTERKNAADAFKSGTRTKCVMRACTPICKMPPSDAMMASGRKTFKTPKLSEAIKHFFDEESAGAHDAMVDARACLRLYWALQDMGQTA